MGDSMETLDDLKMEVERLQRELAEVNHEKIQSAQYGLVLLEEKQTLQQKCEELENLYENTRHELDCVKEALAKFQTSHKASTKTGIEQEESLLVETASREASLTLEIFELENEVKQNRTELERLLSEKERLLVDLNELSRDKDLSEYEKKGLRSELKELKLRETRLLADYSELEEENISLQKQVSSLKSSQVEFEVAKHELRRLQEDVELLNQQVEDLTKLKRMAEKQMEEALETLQAEREQRYALRKELDQRLNNESMFNLSNLRLSGLCEDSNKLEEEEEDGTPILKRLEADFMKNQRSFDDLSGSSKSGAVGDLFSEVHLNEIRKLEKQLEQAENEKSQLSKHLKASQEQLERMRLDVDREQSRVVQLMSHLAVLENVYGGEIERIPSDAPKGGDGEKSDIVGEELARLRQVLSKHERRYEMAARHVADLRATLQSLREKDQNGAEEENADVVSRLRDEVTRLRTKVVDYEQRIGELRDDLNTMGDIASESQSSIGRTHDELTTVCDSLAQLYHHVSLANGEPPNRTLLDPTKSPKHGPNSQPGSDEANDSNSSGGDPRSPPSSLEVTSRVFALCNRLRSDEGRRLAECAAGVVDLSACSRLLTTLRDQVKYLKRAVETTLEVKHQNGGGSGSLLDNDQTDAEELQEQILKLKSLLSTKREQIATLRTVLKANKQTAEVALANLKSKYENEKSIVSETMTKLRNELKALKEDAATFASLRAMFAARCEEYVTQIDEMQRQLSSAEEEKKTLNSLLRMAIQQKLALTQRLEDLEMDRERNNLRRSSGRGGSGGRTGGGGFSRSQQQHSGGGGGGSHSSSNFGGFRSHDYHHHQRRDY